MVRLARDEDIEEINVIRKQVQAVHADGRPDIFRAGFNDELREYIYNIMSDEQKSVIVAESDGKICGFAVLHMVTKQGTPYSFERRFLNLEEFGVDEKFRRKGIGSELMDFITEEAKRLGFLRIELDMWEFNEGALAFYESVGFKTYRRYMEMNLLP